MLNSFGPSPSVESSLLPRAPTACWETVGDKPKTSVESGSPENPKHTARQSETSAGQVGDKCRTMQLRASTAYWERSGGQVQNHGAQSTRSVSQVGSFGPEHPQHTGRQVGDKCRSLESGGPRHPHLSSKAENQAANLETIDPAQSPGEGDN